MYVNWKMSPIETTPGMEVGRDKEDRGSKFKYDKL
jgi:hypothetical protein